MMPPPLPLELSSSARLTGPTVSTPDLEPTTSIDLFTFSLRPPSRRCTVSAQHGSRFHGRRGRSGPDALFGANFGDWILEDSKAPRDIVWRGDPYCTWTIRIAALAWYAMEADVNSRRPMGPVWRTTLSASPLGMRPVAATPAPVAAAADQSVEEGESEAPD
ncbi:unnamed protein product [Diplocarpon coronariae]